MYGGFDGFEARGDVWIKPLSESGPWTALDVKGPRPANRGAHTAVYDPLGQRMIVYGGHAPDGTGGAVWALSLAETPTWTPLDTGAHGPGDRSGARAVYDPLNFRMVVFGGYSWDVDSLEDEVWVLSLAGTPQWTQLSARGTVPRRETQTAAI